MGIGVYNLISNLKKIVSRFNEISPTPLKPPTIFEIIIEHL